MRSGYREAFKSEEPTVKAKGPLVIAGIHRFIAAKIIRWRVEGDDGVGVYCDSDRFAPTFIRVDAEDFYAAYVEALRWTVKGRRKE
jgi:hypothetical protein